MANPGACSYTLRVTAKLRDGLGLRLHGKRGPRGWRGGDDAAYSFLSPTHPLIAPALLPLKRKMQTQQALGDCAEEAPEGKAGQWLPSRAPPQQLCENSCVWVREDSPSHRDRPCGKSGGIWDFFPLFSKFGVTSYFFVLFVFYIFPTPKESKQQDL